MGAAERKRDAAGLQVFGATPHAVSNLDVDGAFRNPELRGDFLVGKTVDFAKFEHLTAAEGQGVDGVGQEVEFLGATDGLCYTGLIFQDVQVGVFNYALMQIIPPAAEEIVGDVTGCGEKEAASGVQAAVDFRADDLQIRFLDHIVDVGQCGKFLAQIGPKNRFVRLNFLGEPAGSLGLKGGHGRNSSPAAVSLNLKIEWGFASAVGFRLKAVGWTRCRSGLMPR